MKRLTLTLLVAVVLASGCVSQTNDSTTSGPADDTSAPTENPDTSNNTVIFTDSGFQPSTITIQQGETVTWVDESSMPMWVGSDRHPTHTNYAGTSLSEHCQNGDQNSAAFDQCQSGERFSFTFEKTGTWGYHNHERASYRGQVVVE